MTHKMLLDMPDDVYAALVEAALGEGQPPELVAAQRLTDAVRGSELDPSDPLEKWIGAHDVDLPPGWAVDHDRYIGEAIYASMHDTQPERKSDG